MEILHNTEFIHPLVVQTQALQKSKLNTYKIQELQKQNW